MRVLITGVTGQAGGVLARQCLEGGDEVYGLIRWVSANKRQQLQAKFPQLVLIDGDLQDQASLERALQIAKPEVVYNLAALASSGQSWAQPMAMAEINAVGPLKLLEAIKTYDRGTRFIQASTSEQYGRLNEQPQSEKTPFGSLNIYGVAKTFAHQATINYRDSYGMHASTALMHNYVSLDRNPYFVDRKISRAAARIARGLDRELRLGNTEASRDWGWCEEYMQAWRLIAQHDSPGDYVIATGESHSVQEFVDKAFEYVGLEASRYVVRDAQFMRPTDIAELRGDPTYIEKTLGWKATVKFDEIVARLVQHDLDLIDQGARDDNAAN
jgi:GDPmannose 4,6-dehydratase